MGIAVRVTVRDEVHKIPQVFQAEHCLVMRDIAAGVSRGVSGLADEMHAGQQCGIHNTLKFCSAHQAQKVVIPGLNQSGINGIHPLNSELHRPPAADDTCRIVNRKYLLRRHRRAGKAVKLSFSCQKIEIRHMNLYRTKNYIITIIK